MAQSSRTSTKCSRRSSVESQTSLWEKLFEPTPHVHSDAPFADDDLTDSFESNQGRSIDSEENDTDSEVVSPSSPSTGEEKPWLNQTRQQHLRIIANVKSLDDIDAIKQEIREDFARQGLKWNDEEEEIRPWYFGLTSIRLDFQKAQLINVQLLSKATRIESWLKFKTEKPKINEDNQTKKPVAHKFANDVDIKLRYGALTELDQFYYSPKHTWENTPADRDRWTWFVRCDDGKADRPFIQWEIQKPDSRRKKQLFIKNINTVAIVNLNVEGFDIFICQKCNLNEFEAVPSTSNANNQQRQRDGSRNRNRSTGYNRNNSRPRPPPSMSSDNSRNSRPERVNFGIYQRIGENKGCYFPTIQFSLSISKVGMHKQKSKKNIDHTLSFLLEYLLAHNITICYGNIVDNEGPQPKLFFQQPMPNFGTYIMAYSWQMLSIVGYRLQNQMNDTFRNTLLGLESQKNADELIYRVCVYLSRIFSIKPFADINEELIYAIRESKRKQDHSAYGLVRKLDTSNVNEAYIPTVTITPTTIRIKPLKLCRTNRVLRATREFGSALEHFVLIDVRDENGQNLLGYHFQDLREVLLLYLTEGFSLMGDYRPYTYLHHSQSQLRERQFWFYYHEQGKNLSFDDAYTWMGSFDHERNPAKYAARMSLCFSTTKQAAKVPMERVSFQEDIKRHTEEKEYTFTDGCGTMSIELRDKIKKKLHIKKDFSAVQFRYDGSKGVVSLDPTITRDIDLVIRDSMKKFRSPHDIFEVCKLSAPRPLYLNRQAILLLSYRQVPDASFIVLQQQNHLQLIRALLRNNDAEKLILHKVPSWFLPRDINKAKIDYIHEPFFRQLLIAVCVQSMRELLQRTRIRVPQNEGRNMMGVVDEYDVLEHNEVFIQYTVLSDQDADDGFSNENGNLQILNGCQVAITKNPCHHPGDIRTFKAVDKRELRHLRDVVVFSQKGDRPAPHDISGSDLDGDEYIVVWHEDLVPVHTENAKPYDYDSAIQSRDHNGPIDRKVINNIVLEIAENDYLGRLSNLHLAFADKFGVDDNERRNRGEVNSTVTLAGAISIEVDSGKTGYHPLNDAEIRNLNSLLGDERPDFMDKPDFKQYKSQHVLGKLYRSSKRTLRGWNKLVRYHRHLRHLEVRIKANLDEEEDNDLDSNANGGSNIEIDESLFTGIDRNRNQYRNCTHIARKLDYVYRQEILEILNLYGLSHESDLWCRNSVNGLTGELEDTAYAELEQLVTRTRDRIYLELVPYCDSSNTQKCNSDTPISELCTTCKFGHIYTALACYEICYKYAQESQQAPILSLPWIFVSYLLSNRWDQGISSPVINLLGKTMKTYLENIIDRKRRLYFDETSMKIQIVGRSTTAIEEIPVIACAFIEILLHYSNLKKHQQWLSILEQFVKKIIPRSSNAKWEFSGRFHKITHNDDFYVVLLKSIAWSADDDNQIHEYFDTILQICFDRSRRSTENADILEISEDIILLLQRMAIKETVQEE